MLDPVEWIAMPMRYSPVRAVDLEITGVISKENVRYVREMMATHRPFDGFECQPLGRNAEVMYQSGGLPPPSYGFSQSRNRWSQQMSLPPPEINLERSVLRSVATSCRKALDLF